MMVVSVIVSVLLFWRFSNFNLDSTYTTEQSHKCYLVDKFYEGPYEYRSGKSTSYHDPRYRFVLTDEKGRYFDLDVTIETFARFNKGDYVWFKITDQQIAQNDEEENKILNKCLLFLLACVFAIVAVVKAFKVFDL